MGLVIGSQMAQISTDGFGGWLTDGTDGVVEEWLTDDTDEHRWDRS